jgi:uncharacterized phage-associated protein
MYPTFREEKTTQAAAYLIKRHKGSYRYILLIKLLYLADRISFERWNEPITFDQYYSMDNGPVLSTTYNRIKCETPADVDSYWHEFIVKKKWIVLLKQDPGIGKLSPAEIALLDEVDQKFGNMGWKLIDYCHTLPEWKNPKGSSIPIPYDDLLSRLGKPEGEIEDIENELKNQAYLECLMS